MTPLPPPPPPPVLLPTASGGAADGRPRSHNGPSIVSLAGGLGAAVCLFVELSLTFSTGFLSSYPLAITGPGTLLFAAGMLAVLIAGAMHVGGARRMRAARRGH